MKTKTKLKTKLAALALCGVMAGLVTVAGVAVPVAPAVAAVQIAPAANVPDSGRVIVYYQKQFADGTGAYISTLPLVSEGTGVDVVNLAAIHMNANVLNLNDLAPDDPVFDPMWADLAAVQAQGVAVVGMIGGAMNDTWISLQNDYDTQYARLRAFVETYHLDGIELDVETDTPLETAVAVIRDLRADFGPDFLITMSPVTAGILGEPNLSGFDYDELYVAAGADIDWFNTQFYCGWGDPTTSNYEELVRYQRETGAGIPAQKIVMAVLTNPENCGDGWVPLDELTRTIQELRVSTPGFGGVAGWEYFNSLPGGPGEPWRWAAVMRAAMDAPLPGPGPSPTPSPTPSESVVASDGGDASSALAATGSMDVAVPVASAIMLLLLGGGFGVLAQTRTSRRPHGRSAGAATSDASR